MLDKETPPLEEPLAHLERELIAAYLTGAGYDIEMLKARNDKEAYDLLAHPSRYASEKLGEVEA